MKSKNEKAMDAYFKKYNIRLVFAPKTGWTSLRNADVGFEWKIANDIPENAKIVSVYRDPFDRFISSYKEVILKPMRSDPRVGGTIDKPADISLEQYMHNQYTIRSRAPLRSPMSVALYVKSIMETGVWDNHQIRYTDRIFDIGYGRENLKFEHFNFLDFKNLTKEFKEACSDQNLQIPRMQVGANVNKILFNPYRDWIENFYKKDYELIKKLKETVE